ncbi:MAG: type II toxin-antitoxin system HigB family toxin [Bacteroidetes bacterium]|nr:type II toxin-antitoxin system HigB family toxin [Bacteroidota bacterium]
MRVHLIKETTVRNFVKEHALSKAAFEDRLNNIKQSDWDKPADILNYFGSADLLGKSSNRIIFDIGGNKYRMICKYNFGRKEVHIFICWIGTHHEYDRLCSKNQQYTVKI